MYHDEKKEVASQQMLWDGTVDLPVLDLLYTDINGWYAYI